MTNADPGKAGEDWSYSPQELAEGLAVVAPLSNTTNATAKMLLCRVGRSECAVPAADVKEMLPIMRLSRPSGLPRLLAGFFQREGVVVPVVRLARLLEAEEQKTTLYTPIVVLRGSEPLAMMVDAILSLIEVAGESTKPISNQMIADGVAEHDGRLVSIISPARLLLVAETARIRELRAREQARVDELNGAVA